MFKRTAAAVAPPTLEETFSAASGATAYAKSTFTSTISDLTEANKGFAEVEAATQAEIERLKAIRVEAAGQREINVAVIQRLQDLVGA